MHVNQKAFLTRRRKADPGSLYLPAWSDCLAEDTPRIGRFFLYNTIPCRVLIREEKCYQKWTDRWLGVNRFRLTKMFYPAPSKQKTKEVMKLSRKQTSLYVELITGQNNFNYVQSKIKEISPEYRFCEEEDETFPHILNECPVF